MPQIPKTTDALYALTASMTSYAREHKDDLRQIANSIRYADRLPPDFSVLVMRDYMYLEKDYRHKQMTIPEFSVWLRTKGALINGSV